MAGLNLQYLPIFNGSSISSSSNKSNNMSTIGAAAITAGASLLGGLMGSATSKAAQKREFKYNTQLQQQASQLQQENWEKQFNIQNDYNTPEAQRARLEAAGMNPNLAYGNQWVNGMSPAASAPTSSVGHAGEGAAAWSSAMNNMAQIMSMLKVNESIANKNNADAELSRSQTKGQDISNTISESTMQDVIERATLANSKLFKEIGLISKEQQYIAAKTLSEEFNRIISYGNLAAKWEELGLQKQRNIQDLYVAMCTVDLRQQEINLQERNLTLQEALGKSSMALNAALAFKAFADGNLSLEEGKRIRILTKSGVIGNYSITEAAGILDVFGKVVSNELTANQAEKVLTENYNLSQENIRAWLTDVLGVGKMESLRIGPVGTSIPKTAADLLPPDVHEYIQNNRYPARAAAKRQRRSTKKDIGSIAGGF